MSIVTIVPPFTSAREFFDALSPLGNHFNKEEIGAPWLFRGQGKDYPLIPTLFREKALDSFTRRNTTDYGELLLAERDIVIEFFNIADKRGLMLPDDSQELRDKLETLSSPRGDDMIPRSFDSWLLTDHAASLVALGQHYNLPTRLLDWTRHSHIAAFFAADSALKRMDDPNGSMVVWAFYFPFLGKHDDVTSQGAPVRVITAPSATNPNLKAQQGVFTLLNPFYTEEKAGFYPPFEEFIDRLENEGRATNMIFGFQLKKFSLPRSEAGELMRLLAKVDITPSAVYPGFGSIVDDLKMRHK